MVGFFVCFFVFVFCFFVRGYGPPDLATQPTKGKKNCARRCEGGVKVWGRVVELFGRNFCMPITSGELTRGNTGVNYLLLFFCLSNW